MVGFESIMLKLLSKPAAAIFLGTTALALYPAGDFVYKRVSSGSYDGAKSDSSFNMISGSLRVLDLITNSTGYGALLSGAEPLQLDSSLKQLFNVFSGVVEDVSREFPNKLPPKGFDFTGKLADERPFDGNHFHYANSKVMEPVATEGAEENLTPQLRKSVRAKNAKQPTEVSEVKEPLAPQKVEKPKKSNAAQKVKQQPPERPIEEKPVAAKKVQEVQPIIETENSENAYPSVSQQTAAIVGALSPVEAIDPYYLQVDFVATEEVEQLSQTQTKEKSAPLKTLKKVQKVQPGTGTEKSAKSSPSSKKQQKAALGTFSTLDQFLLEVDNFANIEEFIKRYVKKKTDRDDLLRILKGINPQMDDASSVSKKPGFKTEKPEDKDVKLLETAISEVGGFVLNRMQLGLLAKAIRENSLDSARAILSTLKVQMNKVDQALYPDFLAGLKQTYSASGNNIFAQIIQAEAREERLVSLPDIKLAVERPVAPIPSNGGPIFPMPLAPAVPIAPSLFGFGIPGGIKPFEIVQLSDITANFAYEEGSNTLIIRANTLKDCIGSWVQSRVDSVGGHFDVKKLLRTKDGDIKRINSIDLLLVTLKSFVSKFVQIQVPLYESTEELNSDISEIVTSFIEGKVDEGLFDGDPQALVEELVSRTIKPGTVERERLDYVATQIGRNLGSSGQKAEIKKFTTMLGRYVIEDELRVH